MGASLLALAIKIDILWNEDIQILLFYPRQNCKHRKENSEKKAT